MKTWRPGTWLVTKWRQWSFTSAGSKRIGRVGGSRLLLPRSAGGSDRSELQRFSRPMASRVLRLRRPLARLCSTAAASKQKGRPSSLPPLGSVRRPAAAPGSTAPVIPDFSNYHEAYRSKSSAELMRSLLVFRLCSYSVLVDRHKELINLSRALLGKWLFEKVMRMTFYGQFVAGEDQDDIKPLIRHNHSFGVGSILDYSVEEDLTQEEAENKEMESCESLAEKEVKGDTHREKKFRPHRQFGDRRENVISARTYFYADESKCDQYMETFLKCIAASGGSSEDGFSAIKMTALGRPQFLLQFSEVLVKWRGFFRQLAAEQGMAGQAAVDTKLDLERLQNSLVKLGIATLEEITHWFTGGNINLSGTVDLMDWNDLIDNRTKVAKLFVVPNLQTGEIEPLLLEFTEEEELQMKRMLQRVDVLAKAAMQKGVRLMVDAEQTYFQPAISRLTLEMQRKFNTEKPVIFNTYQCYLKDAYDNVSMDVELSRRENWYFGAKLVRGAYMAQERKRAREIGYEDPINKTYEDTNATYSRCLDYILNEIKVNRKANVMVASHNEKTVTYTLHRMHELGLQPSAKQVYFGQLLGMSDQISFPLGQAGYPVYKYVPYGPVEEVLPYLSRRAQENKGMMAGTQRERELLWNELKRRILKGDLFKVAY
ncbi:proline dehydrogenase 1, mitochondrial-like [Carcharodon carcharias]|uniref:proline dehydrogenase 1, mitochondrial-like n=1 Tax=Carcharodon carcharias TaxID=13397 RepID=UPI001B7E962E|nr:proline dehydrogenase 1, mitochondrial-like [Carcharodon carcharias]